MRIQLALLVVIAALAILVVLLLLRKRKKEKQSSNHTDNTTEPVLTEYTEESSESSEYVANENYTSTIITEEITEEHGKVNEFSLLLGRGQTIGSRAEQQDSYLISDGAKTGKGVLVAVADGVGGVKGGAVASNAAVVAMKQAFENTLQEKDPADDLLKAAVASHEAVSAKARQGAGGYSTLVSVLLRGNYMWLLSIGDSRIALYRSGMLLQLNREHVSYRNLMEREYVRHETITAEQYKDGKKLTSYLGIPSLQQIDRTLHPMQLRRGDKIVLMSDGIFGTLTDEVLCEELSKEPQVAADAIIKLIDDQKLSSQDNATILILNIM